jgi:DNA topoisomerase-1
MSSSPSAASLLVVESPAKVLTLRRWLGPEWEVQATSGHLFDLPRNREGLDLARGLAPAWELVRGRSRTLSDLKRAARRVDRVLLATDPDREGEGIAWQLAGELGAEGGSARVVRALLGELTPVAIARAVSVAGPLHRGRWEAHLARRVIDRLIGFRLSARLSSALRPGLSAGRVQVAALRLAADWRPGEAGLALAGVPTSAPPPFTTETLLRAAADRLRFLPRKTMALAQRLYEGVELGEGGRIGLITYPRSASSQVPPAVEAALRALAVERHGPTAMGPAAPAEAGRLPHLGHGAVRPTLLDWPPDRAGEALRAAGGGDLLRLYALVWDRFIESSLSAARRRDLAVARRPRSGPRPERLDDASLIEAVASRGVGRPSTYASIGDSLVARGFLLRTREGLRVTPTGHRLVGWLDRTFPGTLDVRFTADLEARLDEVEAGRMAWRDAVTVAWSPLERVLGAVVA